MQLRQSKRQLSEVPVVQAHLRGEQPPWGVHALSVVLDDVTANVREHITLEREITNYWLAKYFEGEKAANPARTWPALLLHWIRQVSMPILRNFSVIHRCPAIYILRGTMPPSKLNASLHGVASVLGTGSCRISRLPVCHREV